MRVVLVLSEANYVPDNSLAILDALTDSTRLPTGIETVGVVLVKTASWSLAAKMAGFFLVGVRRLAFCLIRNMLRSKLSDPRVRLCQSRTIPVLTVESVNKKAAREAIAALKPDLVVNVRTRNIYRKKMLALPTIGCINVHHGLLPERRGTMCDLWALFEDRPAGFSVHWMNEKIDDGDLLAVVPVERAGTTSYVDFVQRSSTIEAVTLTDILARIKQEGRYSWKENRSPDATHTRNPDLAVIRAMRRKGMVL